ncbi:MAG: hypothetical protein ABI551_19250 [Polyangiaceae bacterium]
MERDRKYRVFRQEIEDRYVSLQRDRRRYNVFFGVALLVTPLLWVWFWPVIIAQTTCITLALVGHYIAMMYRFDYLQQQERLQADIELITAEENDPDFQTKLHEDRARFDTVRAPRRTALRVPFSKH